MISTQEPSLLQSPGMRQFIKFCIVGASSFIIDFGVLYALHHYAGLPVFLAKTLSFTVAVTNGFVWNRLWTFRAVGQRKQHEQYAMFFAVNVVGWALNAGIFTCMVRAITGSWSPEKTPGMTLLTATLVATVFVVFWNFFANKHWTFKTPATGAQDEFST